VAAIARSGHAEWVIGASEVTGNPLVNRADFVRRKKQNGRRS
jgi:hypothetical protein